MKFEPSITEAHGLELLSANMRSIISIGISTGGSAEIQMARLCPNATIIATTIDERGLAETKAEIEKLGLSNRIICKLANCAESWAPLFSGAVSAGDSVAGRRQGADFIYARLVLHYLTKRELDAALCEMRRALKPNGRAFIVVRSIDEPELVGQNKTPAAETGFIHYIDFTGKPVARQFFSPETLRAVLTKNGFSVERIDTANEHCFSDFARTIRNPRANILLEAVVH